MNEDQRAERKAISLLAAAAPSRAPASLLVETLSSIGQTRQRTRWLAYLKEPSMRMDSRVAVGSPTLRIAFVVCVAAALLLLAAGAVGAAASLLPSPTATVSGPTIVYDRDDRKIDGRGIGITGPTETQRLLFPDLYPNTGVNYVTWSPDGSKVVFSKVGIYSMALDGSGLAPVTLDCTAPACVEEMSLSYSPDGKRAVAERFVGSDAQPTETGIAVTDYATGKATMLTHQPWTDGEDKMPRWSPDGQHIVFYRTERSNDGLTTGSGIWSVRVDGLDLTRLTPAGAVFGDPDWSPDGTTIVFDSGPTDEFPNGSQDLFTMKSDGSDLKQITTHSPGTGSAAPRWSPDGNAIVYTALHGIDGELFAMPSAGGEPMRITQPEPGYQHVFAAFRPDTGSVTFAGPSHPSAAP